MVAKMLPRLLARLRHELRSLRELELLAIGASGSSHLLHDTRFCWACRPPRSLAMQRLGLVNLRLSVDVMELRSHLSDAGDLS
jgi:hypothetical protein